MKIEKEYIKEKGKQVLNENGTPRYELDQIGRVIESNIEGVKKGMRIVTDFRGGMPYRAAEDKKSVTVIFDEEDVHAIL